MKTTTITPDQLAEIMTLTKEKSILTAKLKLYLEEQKLQLKRLEEIKDIASHLKAYKNSKFWDLTDKPDKETIIKWGSK